MYREEKRTTLKDMRYFFSKKHSLIFFFGFLLLPKLVFATSFDVSFTSQAPERVWREPWLNACEEASITMVHAYYMGMDETFTIQKAKTSLLETFRIKNKNFGMSFDEGTATIASLIDNFYPWEAKLQENPTLDQIKKQLDLQRPVIVPVYGKALLNPHFVNGGPIYHTIVLSGYDDEKQQFITEEPGTRFGDNYRYSYTTILSTIHDYIPGKKIQFTQPVVIFTAPNTRKLSLIKTSSNPKVYVMENGVKKHILNERVFLSHNWQWENIVTVSQNFLDSLPEEKALTQ